MGGRPFTKLTEIREPVDSFVFLEESDPRNYNEGTWVLNVDPPGWVDGFAIFHGTVTTFAFVDGHVELHRWLEASTIKAATDFAKGIGDFYWSGGNTQNRDFRWVWNVYRDLNWKPL